MSNKQKKILKNFCFKALEMISFQQKKVKSLHKYRPAAPGTAFNPKFIFDAKV